MRLSPHYRNDSDQGLNQEIKAYLDENYLKNLRNIDRQNPKLLVVFSGGNAMGKSTISHKIEQACNGLVLENDAIKRQLLKRDPTLERDALSQITWLYTMDLYRRLGSLTPNGLIIRDGVIDWYYDRIVPIFERAGYSLFIIGFNLSRAKAIELIKKRGDTPTVKEERFYVLLDDHAIHIKRFRSAYTPDVVLTDDTVFDHDLVVNTLQQKLAALTSKH